MKATLYRPKSRKRKKKHGFLKRSRTNAGQKVLRRRMRKGRKKLTI
ncbi:MAG: 50S ribosomal protein L34 [bacterium]|nr:50S ribosomal protein L34 [bacterium]